MIADLKSVPGTDVSTYADDTATLGSGTPIKQAEQWAQRAADVLNRHQSLGWVHKTLKKWEGAADDTQRAGETMDGGRTLKTDLEKATAFKRTYATVSKQVRNRKVDCDIKARLKAPNVQTR